MARNTHTGFNGLRGDGGFTLIELMVAVTIASLIMVMAYTSYRTVIQSIARLTDREAFYESVNNAYTFIDRDLSNAYFRSENLKLCMIGDIEDRNSVLNFVTVMHNEFSYQGDLKKPYPVSDIREVGYYLKGDRAKFGRYLLIRREEMHYDEDPEKGGEENVILTGVKGIKFEFKEGNDWTDRWDSRQDVKFPPAVRTTITVIDYEDRENTFVFLSSINMK